MQILLYLFVGFIEMFLATQRTYFISKGKNVSASGIVFIENLIFFFIISQFINNLESSFPIILAYSFGGSMGTLFNFDKFFVSSDEE